MSEAEKRLHRCCFTGHRPNKLHVSEESIIRGLRTAIEKAIADGYRTFITGMCWGVDLWAAEQVLLCRREMRDIHLIGAVPHPDFEKRWSPDWQRRFRDVNEQADIVYTLYTKYSIENYQNRNQWMVDHSMRLICAYNGDPGGTRNTIQYALGQGIEIVYIDMSPYVQKKVLHDK